MARYIDIEAVGIGKAKREQFLVPEYADGWNHAIEIFENEPTADVLEAKHGEWQRQKSGFYFLCSVCGKAAATKGNYCHSCGAKMDGERSDHTCGK